MTQPASREPRSDPMTDLPASVEPREDICLTADEAVALREVLAMLSVMDETYADDRDVLEISRQVWRDMLLGPAQRLRRVTTPRIAP